MAPAVRLFLALCPPEPVRSALAAHAAMWRWPAGARRYASADWHVTLHFLGAVPAERVDALVVGLAVSPAPFTLRFGQPQCWPQGLAVLLPESVPAGLRQLHECLARAVRAQGLATDARPYRPHVTLARHAVGAEAPVQATAFDWPVRGYALLESTGDAARRYRVLRQYGPDAA